MKFTKEEISLCKQIAKKYKKEIEYGDWFINIKSGDVPFLYQYGCQYSGNFVLWTISDCLEFLEEKTADWSLDKDVDKEGKQTGKFCFWWVPSPKYKEDYTIGETLLETCLKAVLAVLEEVK